MTKVIRLGEILDIEIPLSVARCPACDKQIVIDDVEEFEYDDSGFMIIGECGLRLTCISEPDMDTSPIKWDKWFRQHYPNHLHSLWIPLDDYVRKWLNDNYQFVNEPKLDKEQLRNYWTS
jgi:hypothetical protein